MLIPSHSHTNKTQKPIEKPWMLLLLAFVWLWPGVINHDLWKPNEPLIYTLIDAIKQTGLAFVINVNGEIYTENAPIYAWAGAFFKTLFSSWPMSGFTAARLSTAFFMGLALIAAGGAGRELLGKYNGRSVVLILIGCPGIMLFGHLMDDSAILFAALCFFAYGVGLSKRKVIYSGLLIGLALLFGFLSGNLPPLFLMILILVLLPCFPQWHNRSYLLSMICAACIALPLLPLWPYALWSLSPESFITWWHKHALGDFGGFHHVKLGFSALSYGKTLLWYAFPALPLALWAIYKHRDTRQPAWIVCLIWLLLASIILAFQKTKNNDALVLLLPPLAILGAQSLDSLRRGAAAFLNWFGLMTFGFLAVFIWLGFFAINFGFPQVLANYALTLNPYFIPDRDYFPILVAMAFTPIWLLAVTRKNVRGRQAVTNWAAGMTLAWTLILTLFLPFLDSIKSYRPVVSDMEAHIPVSLKEDVLNGHSCISSRSQTALINWHIYGNLPIYPASSDTAPSCHYQLTVMQEETNITPYEREVIWQGHRPRENNETFLLIHTQNIPN